VRPTKQPALILRSSPKITILTVFLFKFKTTPCVKPNNVPKLTVSPALIDLKPLAIATPSTTCKT
jgi:hypothetical protein